jgi:polysaccharide biosynthesis/export protein
MPIFRKADIMRRSLIATCVALTLTGCGAIYQSPAVRSTGADGANVRVVAMTPESVLLANRSPYQPQTLPAVFSQTAGTGGGLRGAGDLPDPPSGGPIDAASTAVRLPPEADPGPYKIGVGDVMILAMPQDPAAQPTTGGGNLSVSQNRRNNYTVQDDGAITVPDLGRVPVAGLTLSEAEDVLFQKLVENQIDPSFNIEIAEFNSSRVAIGGAVAAPGVVPVALSPLYLDEALSSVGGVVATEGAAIRLYRDGQLYQIPLDALYSDQRLERVRLMAGDSIFVDTGTDLNQAQDYFAEQIRVAELRQSARNSALQELNTVVSLNRSALAEARSNYQTQTELGAVDRDYVYLTGEVGTQGRFTMPFGQEASLADALYGEAGGVPTQTGDVSEIYVLRASDDPREFGAVTAWHLDGRNAVNFLLATRFMLRPDDIIFVAEQPVTRWGRVIQQITPSLLTTGVNAASN